MKRIGECKQCGKCCKLIGFWTDNTIGFDEWVLARGCDVRYFENGTKALVSLENRCPNLDDDNKCMKQADKPFVCSDYPTEPAHLLDGCGYSFEEEA